MTTHHIHRDKTPIGSLRALVVLSVTLLLAAGCGVANPFASSSTSSKQNAQDLALKWAQCMRQHGVNVPDPNSNGQISMQATPGGASPGAGSGSGGGSAAPQSGGANGTGVPPEMQAAMDACKQYRPNGGQASGPPSQQQVDSLTKFAQCMRDHGIPMQDPKIQGGSVGIYTSPGAVEPNSDQVKQAQQECQHYMNLPNGGQGGARTTNP